MIECDATQSSHRKFTRRSNSIDIPQRITVAPTATLAVVAAGLCRMAGRNSRLSGAVIGCMPASAPFLQGGQERKPVRLLYDTRDTYQDVADYRVPFHSFV